MKHKKELIVLSLIAITIIGILSGASYAYFQVQQKQGQETVIESGTMALTLEDGATITADNLIPGEYIEKEFTVKNTGTLKTGYDIYLSEVVNTFVNQSDLVYEIISSNGYNTSNQVQVPNTETKIINNYNINPLEEHKYILKITYKLTNENQNDNMGRTFIAKININEYNQNNSERYIKLYDASNNEIDKQVLTNNSDYYYPLSNINLSNSTNIYCDNGGIPTIENNQLKVSEVTSETICKISNSIRKTMTNLSNTKTGIVMTNSETVSPQLQIGSEKDVVLDLNNNTIYGSTSHGMYIPPETIVSIKNGSIISNNDTNASGICNNGLITLNNVYVEGPYGLACFVNNTSSAELNNVEIKSRIYDGINTYINFNSTIDANNVVVNGKRYAIYNAGTGTINIDGGEINTIDEYAVNNNGIININEGAFISVGKTINNSNSGTINITGGTFESTTANAIVNYGLLNINQSDKPIYIASYSTPTTNPAILNYSKLNIIANQANDCTRDSNTTKSGLCVYAAENGANIALQTGKEESEARIDGGTYYGGTHGINVESNGIAYIKNVYINSKNVGLFNGSSGNTNTTTYICNSTINAPTVDFKTFAGTINYANNNIFSNGTNEPINILNGGTVVQTDDACNWLT